MTPLKKYNYSQLWKAEPQMGQLYFCGTNIHTYFNSSFLKDHDFVLITNQITGKTFAVDPTLYDYFFITFVTFNH